jgi:hypothetical protein
LRGNRKGGKDPKKASIQSLQAEIAKLSEKIQVSSSKVSFREPIDDSGDQSETNSNNPALSYKPPAKKAKQN